MIDRNAIIVIIVYENGECREYHLTGRVGQTIHALVMAGRQGVTALEMSSWALRLGAYIHTLRHRYQLVIHTVMEPHEGGMHARYVLESPVTIARLEMQD
ncbi:MAG: hypothetical protein H6908_00665 [Hyphomicrobiales bacterium]|nr:hypothetical protein [Hyphomicrobiales bacterium]